MDAGLSPDMWRNIYAETMRSRAALERLVEIEEARDLRHFLAMDAEGISPLSEEQKIQFYAVLGNYLPCSVKTDFGLVQSKE